MKTLCLNLIIILIFAGIAGCSSTDSSNVNDETSKIELPINFEIESSPSSVTESPPVPKKVATSDELSSDIGYTIINKELDKRFSKVTINVRLNKEIGKDGLKKIAYKIKEDYVQYSKLWIFYFLPEMNTGSGAWAISHFKPTLELEIIGASKSATDEMKNKKVTGEILSTWIDNDAILPNTKYLVKENGKLKMKSVYARTKYVEATELIEELTKTTYRGKTRFNYKNNHGDYYLIEQNGNLSIYDSDGKFKELKKQ